MQIPIHKSNSLSFENELITIELVMMCDLIIIYFERIINSLRSSVYGVSIYCDGRRLSAKYSLLFISVFFSFYFHFSIIHLNFEMRIHSELCSIDWFQIEKWWSNRIIWSIDELKVDPFYDWFIHFNCQKFNFTEKYQMRITVYRNTTKRNGLRSQKPNPESQHKR